MKKKVTILCLMLLPIIIGCANQITQTGSNLTLNSPKSGIIREFTGSNKKNTHDENLLRGDYNFGSIAINNNIIYYSSSINLVSYNTSTSILKNLLPSCYRDIMPTVGWSPFKRDDYIPLCDYMSGKFKQGNDGFTYVFNNYNISKLSPAGSVVPVLNNVYEGRDTIAAIAVDKDSNVYYASQNTVIKYNPQNNTIEILFNKDKNTIQISDLEIDSNGNIYVFDQKYLKVKKIVNGNTIDIIGGGDLKNLNISAKDYNIESHNTTISIDKEDNIYLIEKDKQRILKYDVITTYINLFAGNSPDSKTNLISGNNPFKNISDLTFDSQNVGYIIDFGNGSIKSIDKNNPIKTLISNSSNHGDGMPLENAYFKNIVSIYSKNNNIYISESDRIRRIDPDYNITTIAGNGLLKPSSPPIFDTPIMSSDTSISNPKILYLDNKNNLYFTENSVLKKLTSDNKIITLTSNMPSKGVTQDTKGNLYFSSNYIKRLKTDNTTDIFAGKLTLSESFSENKSLIPNEPDPSIFQERGYLEDGKNSKEIYNMGLSSIVSDSKNNIYAVANSVHSSMTNIRKNSYIIKLLPDSSIKILTDVYGAKLIIDKEDNIYFLEGNTEYGVTAIRKIDKTGKLLNFAGNIPDSPNVYLGMDKTIINKKATDVYFREENTISDIAVDDRGFIYFSTNEGKLYRIE